MPERQWPRDDHAFSDNHEKTGLVRALGSTEHLFWLLDQNRATHFAMVAELDRQIPAEKWRAALDQLQLRHPLLSTYIKRNEHGVPGFYSAGGRHIPLRVVGEQLFAKVGEVLQGCGLKIGTGTIVDATIIGAPSSTKNKDNARDPEMHQTRKGKQWYFGMKIHIGVDSQTGLTHSAVVTAANVHDKHALPDLLHGVPSRNGFFRTCAT